MAAEQHGLLNGLIMHSESQLFEFSDKNNAKTFYQRMDIHEPSGFAGYPSIDGLNRVRVLVYNSARVAEIAQGYGGSRVV